MRMFMEKHRIGQDIAWCAVCWLGVLMVLPLWSLSASWFSAGSSIFWDHLWETELWRLLYQTMILLIGVTFGSLVLGTVLALTTTLFDFPGRKIIIILCALPLAIPSYVMGFIWLDVLDYNSFVQTFWRQHFQGSLNISGYMGITMAMSFSLFPYVFLMARIALKGVDQRLWEASMSLGHGYMASFRRVIMPMLLPPLLTAGAFVAMEVISDFGTVSVFSYNTLTTAIFKAWFGFFDLSAALQVASVLLVLALGVYVLSRRIHGNKSHWYMHFSQSNDFTAKSAFSLPAKQGYGLFCLCLICVTFTTLLPLYALVDMASNQQDLNTWSLVLPDILRSIFLAFIVSVLIMAISCCGLFLIRSAPRIYTLKLFKQWFHRDSYLRGLFQLPTLGYAFPGAVLAVALFVPVYALENRFSFPFFTTTIALLVAAMAIHFFVVGFQPLAESYGKVPHCLDESSESLGVRGKGLFWRIHWPFLRYPVMFAGLMVFMDVIKEMPLTLMLRPLGWDTMSVKVYEWSSEGEWQKAAVPALVMVVFSMLLLAVMGYMKKRSLFHLSKKQMCLP
ncbi:MAG: iron ABC transporter permease [Proteobacteria bacterium]|nr:iron ABC transporter permease [Pseudomonadota bacterium]